LQGYGRLAEASNDTISLNLDRAFSFLTHAPHHNTPSSHAVRNSGVWKLAKEQHVKERTLQEPVVDSVSSGVRALSETLQGLNASTLEQPEKRRIK